MTDRVSRRSLLALAGGLVAQGCAGGPAAPAAGPAAGTRPSGPGRSGLPWMSGMTGSVLTREAAGEIDALEAFRGRAMDVQTTFANWREGWGRWLEAPFWRRGLPELLAERGIRVAHSTPLLCRGAEGRFAEAARGEFDGHHRTVARRWKDLGHPAPIVRLGWEATDGNYPWSPLRDPSPGFGRYKDAFRRIADVYRHELPGCEIDWNNLRRPRLHVEKIYPGDDWVDLVGADLYGNGPRAVATDEDWAAYADGTDPDGGGPAGPVPYAEFAISRGKRLAVAEWGVTNLDRDPSGPYDSARYIQGMWAFFGRYKDALRYECYFNRGGGNGDHRVYPPEYNPRASAAYRELWHP